MSTTFLIRRVPAEEEFHEGKDKRRLDNEQRISLQRLHPEYIDV
jgi:hypothetical protein